MTWHFKDNIFILNRIIQQDDMFFLVGNWDFLDDKNNHILPLTDTPSMAKLLSDLVVHSIPYDWINSVNKPRLKVTQKVYDNGQVEIYSIGNNSIKIPLQPCYALALY